MTIRLGLARRIVMQLGPRWAFFRAGYALRNRSGWTVRRLPPGEWADRPLSSWLQPGVPTAPADYAAWRTERAGRLFSSLGSRPPDHFACQPVRTAEAILEGRWRYFDSHEVAVGFPPDWHLNPLTGQRADPSRHWSRISDGEIGDVKWVWEPGRFAAGFTLTRAWRRTRDPRFAEAFWRLVDDWIARNPPMRGPHWMCGQETAFRVMAWSFGLYGCLDSPASTPDRIARLAVALAWQASRIEGNLAYAHSQKNNHGVSEAVGLLTVGVLFPEFRHAARWEATGRRLLEEECTRQVYDDGSYVQHSTNYHRLALHDLLWALSLAEANGRPLSGHLVSRFSLATEFLADLADVSGGAPNCGANDGALVLPLADCDYSDMRPTIQAAQYAAHGTRALDPGPWDELAYWLFGERFLRSTSGGRVRRPIDATVGGYWTFIGPESWALVRCASYRDRPSHADQLHVDLWWRGVNIACDAGTYSYSETGAWRNGLAGTAVHNTVSVGQRDQMTRADRFLWLDWARGHVLECTRTARVDRFEAEHDGYRALGILHRRAVARADDVWVVVDDLVGRGSQPVRLHWLLADLPYRFDSRARGVALEVSGTTWTVATWCSDAAAQASLVRAGGGSEPVRGWRSAVYGSRTPALSLAVAATAAPVVRFVTVLAPDIVGDPTVEPPFCCRTLRATVTMTLSEPGQSPVIRSLDIGQPGAPV